MNKRFSTWLGSIALGLLPVCTFAQSADNFPAKPVSLIVPFAPGGGIDQEMNLYSQKLTELLGKQFIVEHKPGASTQVGIGYVAKSPPDGYNILAISGSFTSNAALYKDLPFDAIRDFAPLSLMSEQPLVLMVSPGFAPRNVGEYIAYARANPGKLNFGTGGDGGIQHLVGAWLHSTTNTKVAFIPYKGAAPLITDLLAGRLDVIPVTVLSVLPHIKSGKLRALAVTGDKRSNLLQDVPTVGEQGVSGFSYTNWSGFAVPAATPPTVIARLAKAMATTAKAKEVAGPLEAVGNTMIGSTPEELRKHILAESAVWKKVVTENNISVPQ